MKSVIFQTLAFVVLSEKKKNYIGEYFPRKIETIGKEKQTNRLTRYAMQIPLGVNKHGKARELFMDQKSKEQSTTLHLDKKCLIMKKLN